MSRPWVAILLVPAVPLSLWYLSQAFLHPSLWVRVAFRSLPVLPLAIWAIYLDPTRPLEQRSPMVRAIGRAVMLLAAMAFAVVVLGFLLDWLYDLRHYS